MEGVKIMKRLQSLAYRTVLTLWFVLSFSYATFAAQATLSWNPNSEDDLAGYKIYYGNSSGSYHTSVDVGNQLSYTISNLTEGEEYFFAATAYDFSENESGYSNEVSYDVPIPDFTEPVIVLLGSNPMMVERGSTYTELGVTASDNIDGDITSAVVITGDTVDAAKEGTYYVTYTVTDNAGNTDSVNRTVTVKDTIFPADMTGLEITP